MVDTRGGKSTTPYTKEQEERVTAILKERKEEAKKQTLLEEQAAKKKKLEEEMERLKREEEEKLKEVEEEEEEGEEMPLVQSVRREERGESSGISEEKKMEKMVSEWVANFSLGEDEEALMYIPQDERDAAVAEIQALTDPLQRHAADIDVPCSPASVRKYRDLLIKARANMQKAQVRMLQQANRRRLPCPFREGDLVWVLSEEFALEQDVSRKLLPKWFGPWEVTSAVGDDPAGPSFVINIPPHLTVHRVFHASKLAIYMPPPADEFPGRRSQDPPSMDGHQEVDQVITHRKYGNKPRQYKVTFKQCALDDTRWISSEDLQTSAPLIFTDYEKRRLAKDAARPARPTSVSDRQLRPRR
ncbi:hypothetical protein CBR_g52065 [Chara braunii]|uniref:Tf2-1-like SH3-like domain-containing protein n=1 Tax=Chara braunii TaxID=69332 RepID=A0A388M9M2_CHABU|nr:hypothetical protein CBR_g52065 [Chara braunii]|eukprot:GBG91183.1 hypothetical protein CBR_g52065 [Chara braunii]